MKFLQVKPIQLTFFLKDIYSISKYFHFCKSNYSHLSRQHWMASLNFLVHPLSSLSLISGGFEKHKSVINNIAVCTGLVCGSSEFVGNIMRKNKLKVKKLLIVISFV